MNKLLALSAVLLLMCSCNQPKKSHETQMKEKILVMYYSQTGATQTVAQEIADLLGADTLRFDVEEPYNTSYKETIERCQKEMETNTVSKLKKINIDLTKYQVIFLGYPIWFGTYARPVMSLLAVYNFKGMKIVPFCTFGSGGLEASVKNLKEALPEAEIGNGYGVRNARIAKAPAEVKRFLTENGFLDGQIEPLPEYSEQAPVTPSDTEVFNAACGDYPMPIGTPVSVGKRTTQQGVDYLFKVTSKDREGNDMEATVFVTQENDTKPEFIRVVR